MKPAPSPRRRRLRTGAKLLASGTIFLLTLELVVRIVMPVDTFIAAPNRWDRATGLHMIENGRGSIDRPEYRCDFQINSRGLRERETPLEPPQDERRILFLGDSYTCGFGVEPEQAFSRVVESLTGWRAINAGVGATGTAHQLAYYLDEGRHYGADLVVLGFVANDFGDNVGSGLFRVENDALVRHDSPRSMATWLMEITRRLPGYHTVLGRSHALARVKQGFAAWWYGRRVDSGRVAGLDEPMPERRLDLSVRLVRALDTAVRNEGARLLVVVVPLAADLDVSPEPLHELARRVRAADVTVLDLEEARDLCEAAGVATYYPVDGHWNVEGHRRYGRVIAEVVNSLESSVQEGDQEHGRRVPKGASFEP